MAWSRGGGERGEPDVSLGVSTAEVMSLYLRLIPAAYFTRLREQQPLRRLNHRVYTDAVVIWLMVVQCTRWAHPGDGGAGVDAWAARTILAAPL
jgi:hypothetical protein